MKKTFLASTPTMHVQGKASMQDGQRGIFKTDSGGRGNSSGRSYGGRGRGRGGSILQRPLGYIDNSAIRSKKEVETLDLDSFLAESHAAEIRSMTKKDK